jgi:hypothetical protein
VRPGVLLYLYPDRKAGCHDVFVRQGTAPSSKIVRVGIRGLEALGLVIGAAARDRRQAGMLVEPDDVGVRPRGPTLGFAVVGIVQAGLDDQVVIGERGGIACGVG